MVSPRAVSVLLGSFALSPLLLASCGTGAPAARIGETDESSGAARAHVRMIEGRFFGAPSLAAHAPASLGATPQARRTIIEVPPRANLAAHVRDASSGMALAFTLEGTSDVVAVAAEDFALYRGALAGADVFHRVRESGTEDYVVFETKPAREALAYTVSLAHVAGLRLVGNTLELLDPHGTPVLRVPPPYVVDAHGARHDAKLSLAGCAYDTSPAPPWDRPVTAPGASTCALDVTWSAIAYPALVDPGWTSTGDLARARAYHTATILPSGKVVVAGGETDSVEMFDPATKTFATLGAANSPRSFGTATLLGNGKILFAGGMSGLTVLMSAEVYDPATGRVTVAPGMNSRRSDHRASLLPSGDVLLSGGRSSTLTNGSSDVYVTASASFVVQASVVTQRYLHTATTLPSGKILIAGGAINGGDTLAGAELYDPATKAFTKVAASMHAARYAASAVLLTNGTVLLAGGDSAGTAETFDPTTSTFTSTGSMTLARSYYALAGLANGSVLATGGYVGATDRTDTSELYDPTTRAFRAINFPLPVKVAVPTVTSLAATGTVLLTGGEVTDTTYTNKAALFVPTDTALGSACSLGAECNSGQCADGICCDRACGDKCEACDVAGHAGTCMTVVGAPHGTRPACGGAGGECGFACNGVSTTECSFSTGACGGTCASGTETPSACNGQGACEVQTTRSCGSYICADATKCRTDCVAAADCAFGFTCVDGACIPGATCVNDHTAQPPQGAAQECAPYKCAAGCKTSCVSIDDCVSPNVCGTDGKCTPAPTDDTDGGCNTTGGPSSAAASLLALALLVLPFVRRRRRAA